MSDLENSAKNFLQRWSQRKRAAGTRAPSGIPPLATRMNDDPEAAVSAQGEADLPEFDPATLPSIESITAISDIRAFLASGVPEELTRAALRRVWVSDPTIRDFVGIAENQWDFTNPDGVPGFAPLELTPELRSMVASLFGDAPAQILPQTQTGVEQAKSFEEIGREEPIPGVLGPSQENGSTELPPQRPNLVRSLDAFAEPARVMPQNSNSTPAAPRKIGKMSESPRSTHRTRGGAVPK